MRLSAIIQARTLAFVESFDMNPHGAVFYPTIVQGLVEKFGFMKYPQKIEEFDEMKGVDFLAGTWSGMTVEKFTIYRNGLLLDTRVSTEVSKQIILEGAEWAASTFGLTFAPEMISRWGFLSSVVFYSDCPNLLRGSPAATKMRDNIQRAVTESSGDDTDWEPTVLTFHSESVPRKPVTAPFTIQRRAETSFSENKYYSEAALPTDVHLALLEQFEADVVAESK
jgi:hypothetical protein